ncbi:hypothetical protein [Halobacteriovorax sp. FRX-3]|uniref:hypothetical protein n=1 Tax=Halobacteriovorax sp. FRX-3 TaxID=3157712 RepID=UPI00371BF9C1
MVNKDYDLLKQLMIGRRLDRAPHRITHVATHVTMCIGIGCDDVVHITMDKATADKFFPENVSPELKDD